MMAYLGDEWPLEPDEGHVTERDIEEENDADDPMLCACGEPLHGRDDSKLCLSCRMTMLADLGR